MNFKSRKIYLNCEIERGKTLNILVKVSYDKDKKLFGIGKFLEQITKNLMQQQQPPRPS